MDMYSFHNLLASPFTERAAGINLATLAKIETKID